MSTVELRVSEACPWDVGRGLCRMHPADMAALGLKTGDVAELTGRRVTVARVIPARPEDRQPGWLHIDGLIRSNCGVGTGDRVRARPVNAAPALKLVLRCVDGAWPSSPHQPDYLCRLLDGIPVLAGDAVRAALFGGAQQEFRVLRTVPPGPVLVQADSVIQVEPAASEDRCQATVSYEDVGGLKEEIMRVREMIELPLRHPELFRQLGIDPPKGVLLHGPPGCGKTLIARAVASATSAWFTLVNGPEIMHRFYGESEANLRGVFEEAKARAPSVVFLDEIDAIAPRRAEVHGEVEKRVVAQLLALMDGLEPRGQVVVIGATNIPEALDPALRRPGRFDREIEVRVPDRAGRLDILRIHSRGMPLGDDVSLADLAATTHGFVGADLQALCREAAMAALRRAVPELGLDGRRVPEEVLAGLRVTGADFAQARREVGPSAIREIFVEVPEVAWEDVGGLEGVKAALQEAIEWPLRFPDMMARAGLSAPRGIILHGPPGTGKTLLAKAVAARAGTNFISVKGPALFSKYVGESERAVRYLFRRARQASPCVVFIDELDAVAGRRGSGEGDGGVRERVLGQLLLEMDGVEGLQGVVVLAATNRLDLIDPALLRPGRFDLHLEVPLPGPEARAAILGIHLRRRPLAPDVDLAELAELTEGLSGADLAAACRQAALAMVREHMGRGGRFIIGQEHLRAAVEAVRRRREGGAPCG
ncbi:MAG: CDC48 family AAA ATPase [Acetobacteraceae bacterium]|nr:CDC48 family AAA ATPase [Acetobacteraceae bacterium]